MNAQWSQTWESTKERSHEEKELQRHRESTDDCYKSEHLCRSTGWGGMVASCMSVSEQRAGSAGAD